MYKIIRTIVDILMFLTLPVMMGGNYLIPEDVIPVEYFHEHLGKVVFGLWTVHAYLNRNWYTGLFRGRYTAMRILQIAINIGVLLSAFSVLFSGIVLGLSMGPVSLARDLHLIGSHWYIVFASLHIGMHLDRLYKKTSHPKRGLALQLLVTALGAYGVYALITHEILLYLFAQAMFFNPHADSGLAVFFAEALSIIALFANVGFYALMLARKK